MMTVATTHSAIKTAGAFAPRLLPFILPDFKPYESVASWPGVWVLACTEPRHVTRCQNAIEAAEIPCYVPYVRAYKIERRQRRKVALPLFAGYIFACVDCEHSDIVTPDERRYAAGRVREGWGVIDAIEIVNQRQFVQEISHIQRALAVNPDIDLHPEMIEGCRVRILHGPMEGVEGVIESRGQRSRIAIRLTILQASAVMDVDPENLELVN
jgi:transcription antitermination factor NusG